MIGEFHRRGDFSTAAHLNRPCTTEKVGWQWMVLSLCVKLELIITIDGIDMLHILQKILHQILICSPFFAQCYDVINVSKKIVLIRCSGICVLSFVGNNQTVSCVTILLSSGTYQ